jgi:hypothetical protein
MEPARPVPDDYKSPSLRRWRVIEVISQNGTRTRHIYGHDVTNGAGRASSSIKEFDLESMTVTTKSGTRYKLVGLPGRSRVGDFVWKHWCRAYGVVSEVDVTHEYFSVDTVFPKPFESKAST